MALPVGLLITGVNKMTNESTLTKLNDMRMALIDGITSMRERYGIEK